MNATRSSSVETFSDASHCFSRLLRCSEKFCANPCINCATRWSACSTARARLVNETRLNIAPSIPKIPVYTISEKRF